METKQFYYIKTTTTKITVTLAMFDSGPLPIVWIHNGLCTMFRIEIVEDAFLLLAGYAKLDMHYGVILHQDDTEKFDIKYLTV